VSRPGIEVSVIDQAPPAGAKSSTGTWFATGFSDKGSTTEAVRVTSLARFVALLGNRRSDSVLYDAAETFFRNGGAQMYVGRVIGPAAATAQVTISAAITVKAASPGEWGNNLSVQVIAGDAGGEYKLVVFESGTEVERSPSLVDNATAANWALASSSYIRVTAVTSTDPAITAATPLTGGVSDVANATDTQWATALALFAKALGPGQVSHPGRTTTPAHTQLLAHADTNNRVAILDIPDTATVATLTGAVAALRALTGRKRAAAYGPWAVIPGLTPGTTRTVPYSAVQAGLTARADVDFGPHRPAAGIAGVSNILGLSQIAWTDAERTTLNEAGVNVARVMDGQVRTYGARSVVNPQTEAAWREIHQARTVMAVQADAEAIGERYIFRNLDAKGHTLAEYRGELTAALRAYYDRGALYGQTPDEAFVVDVGESVNTPATIANGEIRAAIAMRIGQMGELVTVTIVKTRTEEAI
jgi:hypothetical protein